MTNRSATYYKEIDSYRGAVRVPGTRRWLGVVDVRKLDKTFEWLKSHKWQGPPSPPIIKAMQWPVL